MAGNRRIDPAVVNTDISRMIGGRNSFYFFTVPIELDYILIASEIYRFTQSTDTLDMISFIRQIYFAVNCFERVFTLPVIIFDGFS